MQKASTNDGVRFTITIIITTIASIITTIAIIITTIAILHQMRPAQFNKIVLQPSSHNDPKNDDDNMEHVTCKHSQQYINERVND